MCTPLLLKGYSAYSLTPVLTQNLLCLLQLPGILCFSLLVSQGFIYGKECKSQWGRGWQKQKSGNVFHKIHAYFWAYIAPLNHCDVLPITRCEEMHKSVIYLWIFFHILEWGGTDCLPQMQALKSLWSEGCHSPGPTAKRLPGFRLGEAGLSGVSMVTMMGFVMVRWKSPLAGSSLLQALFSNWHWNKNLSQRVSICKGGKVWTKCHYLFQ